MKHKQITSNIIAILLAVATALMPAPAFAGTAQTEADAGQDITIYYPDDGQALILGEQYRVRFDIDADVYSFQVGVAFTRQGISVDKAFGSLIPVKLSSRPVGDGSVCYSLDISANREFGAAQGGKYRLWVFAYRADGTMIAGEYIPVEVRTAPQTEREGWFTDGGLTYYGRDGRLLTGWHEFGIYFLNSRKYYFDESGVMQKGWIKSENKWYYLDNEGLMHTGWLETREAAYYLDPLDGHMYTYWCKIDGGWYYFHPESGKLQTGWLQQGSERYYLADGRMYTGWQQVLDEGGQAKWYYFAQPTGSGSDGLRVKDGARYFAYPNGGALLTGWQQLSESACGTDGPPTTDWYYLYNDGGFATGWQEIGGSTYRFNDQGAMHTGWAVEDGNTYYFNPASGVMLTGVQTIDGEKYEFDSDGRLVETDN